MINYTNQYIQSILSTFSYSTFNDPKKSVINVDLSEEIITERFSELILDDVESEYVNLKPSIDFFVKHFEILNQEISLNGFSATTYQLKSPIEGSDYKVGEIFVSYRGTQPTDLGDWLSDIRLTFSSNRPIHNTLLSQEKGKL